MLDWITMLLSGLWALLALYFGRDRRASTPRPQLYLSTLVMRFVINFLTRWQIARRWRKWQLWGVEHSRVFSLDAKYTAPASDVR